MVVNGLILAIAPIVLFIHPPLKRDGNEFIGYIVFIFIAVGL
jgi:hypothetical protein